MNRLLSILLLLLACGAEQFPSFTTTRQATATGVSVTFTPERLPLEYSRLAWDFGDGTTSTETTPTHLYPRNARYTVVLTVEDDDGVVTVPLLVSVEENPLPQALHAAPETPGIHLQATNLLQLAPVEGTAALTAVSGEARAFRVQESGGTTPDIGGVPSILFRPSGGERRVELAADEDLNEALLETTHAYSPAWFLDDELLFPSEDPMPRMKYGEPARLSLSPTLINAQHALASALRIELASELDGTTVDEVSYLLRGSQGLLQAQVTAPTGTAPHVFSAHALQTLGAGVVEVYATLRNESARQVEGETVTAANAVRTWGALLLTE